MSKADIKLHARKYRNLLLYDWKGTSALTDIYRDGVLIATVEAGVNEYQISCNPNQTYECQVCEGGTQICSNIVRVK